VVTVTAGNTPPEVTLLAPQDGDFHVPGEPVRWRAAVKDVEEGDSGRSPDNFGPRLLVSAALDRGGVEAPGLALMKRADCFNCHAPEHRIVGPAFLEIAERYRGQDAALETSVDRVQRGSTGVWGPVPMLPHGHHTRDQIREMVQWVFALQPGADRPLVQRGLEGEFLLPAAADGAARLRIEAVFADAGNGAAGPLHGRAVATLRPRRIEAEACDERHGTQVLGGTTAAGGKFIGDTHHGQWLRFAALRTGTVGSVTVRAASGGQGGRVEFRAGKPDGPLLAALDVPVTGGWETWQEIRAPFTRPAATSDVYLVFHNPGRGGLMNVDWVRFDP
jgi:cytochrome c